MLTVKKILETKIWIASVLALVIALIFVPIWILFQDRPAVSPLGVNIKNGDRVFYNFLEDTKANDGIIILGTSETGNSLDGKNYWALLDKDEELDRNFYSFGGAGRCSYVYFPLILDNPEAFKDLEIIYYINPTYWRKGLNGFNVNYYTRYINPQLALSTKTKATKEGIYEQFMAPGIEEKTAIPFYFERTINNYKLLYASGLSQKKEAVISDTIKERFVLSEQGAKETFEITKTKLSLPHNALVEYAATENPFPQIDTTTSFQDDMLIAFIKLTKDYGIDCKFYLGPYNGVYCQKMSENRLEEYEEVMDNIKHILKTHNVEFIDGSYQSNLAGTFLDVQHISEYGAYLTAMDIKAYYEKSH